MRCRIADESQLVERITWEPAEGTRREVVRRTESAPAATSAELAQLKAQLLDSERRRQADVAHARQEGFAEGARQAREEAAGEARAAIDRVASTLVDLANTKMRIRNDAESELLKLSLAIARRVLHRELALDPEALGGVVHAALQKLQNREVSRVRVFPPAVETVRLALERFGAPPNIEIYPDPSLRNGDLIFDTTLGQLDASVESQLQEIQRGLADRLALR